MNKEEKLSLLKDMISNCEEGLELDNPSSFISEDKAPLQLKPSNQNASGKDKAYKRLLNILSYSDRSELELRNKLKDASFSEEEIEFAIQKAKRFNFINDERFGRYFVESQMRMGKGQIGIRRDLKAKGFDEFEIDTLLEECPTLDESESERALHYLQSHAVRSKNIREGAFRKLIRRGFSTSAASEAAKAYTASVLNQ